MSANTYGRQTVEALTNKSGGGVVAGDVVVIDTTNNDAFTTDTAGTFLGMIGIAQETIANNAVGRVLTQGYAALVNVNASVTRGHYGKTYTVAKQATDAGAARVTGAFCQFLTGGTTPDAHVFGMPDGSSASGSVATDPIWTAAGQLAVATGTSTATVLAKGNAGGYLAMGNSTLIWNAGTSFPGSKATNDRYWRTDLGMEFYWDGTRWLCTCPHVQTIGLGDTTQGSGVATIYGRMAVSVGSCSDLYIERVGLSYYIVTTNDGSNYWSILVDKQNAAAAATNLVTHATSAESPNANIQNETAVNAVLGGVSTYKILILRTIKTAGAPGVLYLVGSVAYRFVAT